MRGHPRVPAGPDGRRPHAYRALTTRVESSGAVAYGIGRYTLALTPPGGSPVQDVGKYVVTDRRQRDGAWKAVADVFNSDRPPPP